MKLGSLSTSVSSATGLYELIWSSAPVTINFLFCEITVSLWKPFNFFIHIFDRLFQILRKIKFPFLSSSLCYCCCLQTYISWLDEWNRRKLKKNNNNLCRMVIHPKRHLLQWRFCLNQNKIILKKLIFDLCGFWLPWRWFIRKRNDSDLVFLSLKSFKD